MVSSASDWNRLTGNRHTQKSHCSYCPEDKPFKDLFYSWEISIHTRSLSFSVSKGEKKPYCGTFYNDLDLYLFLFYPAGETRAPQKHKMASELWPPLAFYNHGYSKASITWFMLLFHVVSYSNPTETKSNNLGSDFKQLGKVLIWHSL